jgi:hypothetical protein
VAPKTLLDVVFGKKLSGAAPAFATLVVAMVCLCVTVVVTVYLLGVGWRWVVLLLAAGTGLLVVFTLRAHGQYLGTARADLAVQAGLALATAGALVGVHRRSGRRWLPADIEEAHYEEPQIEEPRIDEPDRGEPEADNSPDQGPVAQSRYRGPG